jgi:chemotaxis protein MotB
MTRRSKNSEESHVSRERWMITYADLITLLLIFFVVMYSMSHLDAEKFKAIAESLSIYLGGGASENIGLMDYPAGSSLVERGESSLDGEQIAENPEEENYGKGNAELETMTLEGIKAKLDQFAAANNIQTKLVSNLEERGLVVSIQETLLFESSSAEITPGAHAILEKISSVLAAVPNYIRVEGHTDYLPIHTEKFPSNWELSVLRATNVVHILINEGKIRPERLSAIGFGEYRPIGDNKTEEGRSKNRRVDLVILNSIYDLVEPGN